jgi:hypothetical protein
VDEQNRARYDHRRLRYPSDLTDDEWDATPGNDPSAAYEVTPTEGWPEGWTVRCCGIPRFGTRQQDQCRALRHGCRVPRQLDSGEVCQPLKGRSRAFDEAIPLPNGRMLITLGDVGRYIAVCRANLR